MSPAAVFFSPEVRAASLALANETRSRRAALKRAIRAGTTDGLDVLGAPPSWLGSMLVIDLVQAYRGVSEVKATAALSRCGLRHGKTIGSLSDRQRGVLADELRAMGVAHAT